MNRLTAIETFSGAGGMALGLQWAGIDMRLAFDIDPMAVLTYNQNIAPHCQQIDASRVHGNDLLNDAGLSRGTLDLLTGGPPCQGFSKQRRGAHLLSDERNGLVLHYARLVRETAAKAFIFENVEIFGQKRGQTLVNEIKELLSEFDVYTFFVCSSDFGLAQRRGRFLMMGFHKDINASMPALQLSSSQKTVKDVIGHLPSPPDDYTEHPDYPNHIKCRITTLNEKRFACVPPGGGWQDIPNDLRLPCHKDADPSKGGWPDVYGRLRWDDQCPTITAGFDSFTRGRYGHPSENRSLTLHEGALLQGFPEDFRFYGTRYDIRLQIGNAVPPPLAKAAAEAAARAIQHSTSIPPLVLWPKEREQQMSMAI